MTQQSRKPRPPLKFLTVNELNSLNTKRLLGVLNSVRAVEHSAQRNLEKKFVCCDLCNEWILGKGKWNELVGIPTAHLTAYKNRIKKILKFRKHIA